MIQILFDKQYLNDIVINVFFTAATFRFGAFHKHINLFILCVFVFPGRAVFGQSC